VAYEYKAKLSQNRSAADRAAVAAATGLALNDAQ
jgi:predicted FMN-binding regulatory protein PaiB